MKLFRRTSALLGVLAAAAFLTTEARPARSAAPAHPLPAPLSASDPAAQVDPRLLSLPPITARYGGPLKLSPSAASQTVSHSLLTGETIVGAAPTGGGGSYEVVGSRGSAAAEQRLSAESVIGEDERVRIDDTTDFPWSAQCKLFMRFPSGAQFIGSGTLISAKYVITAGHCIYSAEDGGWAEEIIVVPGLAGNVAPFGTAEATNLRTWVGWTSGASPDYDMGVITLDVPIGLTTGWFGFAAEKKVIGLVGNIAGYPGDRDGGLFLYYDFNHIQQATALRVFYPTDTFGGQSGSGVYYIKKKKRMVFAAHAYGVGGGVTLNSGTRIDKVKFKAIKSWIKSGS